MDYIFWSFLRTCTSLVEFLEGRNRRGKSTTRQPYLRLELETKNDRSAIPRFSPGEIIKGQLIVDNGGLRRIKKTIIQLFGVEHTKWRRSRIICQLSRRK